MISPTVGRVVWFWPNGYNGVTSLDDTQPMAATIAFVRNNRCVNLSVTDHLGTQFPIAGVCLLQGDESYTPVGAYCQWMPHQVGQAKKDEKAQFFNPALGKPFTDTPVGTVTDDMVSRFLSWSLPNNFAPDCYITFMPVPGGTWPTGTNLFNASQARAMLEHVLGTNLPATPQDGTDAATELCRYLARVGRDATERLITENGVSYIVKATVVHRDPEPDTRPKEAANDPVIGETDADKQTAHQLPPAEAMCEHVISMGACAAEIPVTYNGRYFIVTVEPGVGHKPKGSAPFYDCREQFSGPVGTGAAQHHPA